MSDGALSQDEIDALLTGGSNPIDAGTEAPAQPPQESAPTTAAQPGGELSDAEVQAFQDLLGEVAESQGSNLSILTGKTITLGKPSVTLQAKSDLTGSLPEDLVEVRIDFTNGVPGEHFYILADETANTIAGLMMGQAGGELDDAALTAVTEAVQQITGSFTTALGDKFGLTLTISAPELEKVQQSNIKVPSSEPFVSARYPLSIEGESDSELVELFAAGVVKQIVASYAANQATNETQGVSAADQMGMQPSGAPAQQPGADIFGTESQNQLAGTPIEQQMNLGAVPGAGAPGAAVPGASQPNVQSLQFSELQSQETRAPGPGDQGNISLLMDVFMEMTVELGRTRKPIKEILGIGEGTILELDKLAGEPVDILVNHKLIAKGEVVVIDENFGVRVTEIISTGIERLGNIS